MTWNDTALARSLGVRFPVVQAPMAGGWTTPELVAETSIAGGLGSLAGGMCSADQLRALIHAVRSLTDRPFAVNLFAPMPAPSLDGMADWARRLGVPVPTPPSAPPTYADQLDVVVTERVPVLSFTFGLPSLSGIDAFVVGTATTVLEAVHLEAAGVNAVVAQGAEAGGHRGTFLTPAQDSLIGTLALVPQVVDAVSVPVIAAGGIMDGRGLAAVRVLGAQGAQLGTAFLATEEAAVPEDYRNALERATTVTDVLTGRPARAVRTAEVDHLMTLGHPPDYPLPRLFNDAPTWFAGQGGAMARRVRVRDLVAGLDEQAQAALQATAS